jgi:hypothetical protein
MQSNSAGARRTDTAETPECEPLLDIALPDVYRKNPFRTLGLPVDTSLREAAKELNRRQMLAELGQTASGAHGRLELRPAPTVDDFRAAEGILHDPQLRLVHELFWFWPLEPGSGQPDPALQAIQAGDLKTASSFWDAARKDPAAPGMRSAIAKHNTAVRWHFYVLDIEAATEGKCWDDAAQADNVRKTWVAALSYWSDCLRGDAIWNALSARVIALDDDRASLEFVQSMRKTAGRALLKISATLALRYVDLNVNAAALAHLTVLLDSPLRADSPAAIEEFLVAPLKESIRQRILNTESGRTSDPAQAKDTAYRLIAKFSGYLPLLTKLVADGDPYDLAGLFDEVVSECQSCAVAYYGKTNDGPPTIALLEVLLPLARSEAIRAKVEENIATGKGNVLADKLSPLHEPLTAIEESKEAPRNCLAEFVLTIDPLLLKLEQILSMSGAVQDVVNNRIARLLRNISVDAWNTSKDHVTAFEALGRADKFARSTEIKTQLATDRAALVGLYAAERREQQTKKNKKYAWIAGIGVAAAIVIAVNRNDNSPSAPAQLAAATQTSTLNVNSNPTADTGRTYSVPHYMTDELNRDRAAVEAAQRVAADLQAQLTAARTQVDAEQSAAQAAKATLDEFGERIERARALVPNEDASAVARLNSDVAKYNRMVAQVRQKLVASDALVDPYNNLLARAKAKAAEADRLVDAYNEKLARVGH